jgi:NADPH:quinone reductase
MRAIVRRRFGGPEELVVEQVPDPDPVPGQVIIEVKAIGLNHAEIYMRKGLWGDVPRISGIECVGVVRSDPGGRLAPGTPVSAIMGGMGRTIDGSYAELTRVPASNVVPIEARLPWEDLAAVAECYATAWTFLFGNLELGPGQTLLVRGATSALGQAVVNIAADAGAVVLATSRNRARLKGLEAMGAAHGLLEEAELSNRVRELYPPGIDAVVDLVGNSTILDSLKAVRRRGRVCLGGFLGGLAPIEQFNPLMQLPGGVHLSFFGSFVFGTPEFPLSEIPLNRILDKVASGTYQAKPVKVFPFDEMPRAHRFLESNEANGKVVVKVA